MKTFCVECMKETESTLYAEVRECKACGKMWECPGNPETTALKARVTELEAALKSFFARAIVTDTNGDYCLICDGMDLDHEGVIHHKDCPVCEAERVLEGGAE